MHNTDKLPDFLRYLTGRLKEPLPGEESQLKMAPVAGGEHYRDFTPKESSKQSAVLILLAPGGAESKLRVLLTLRSSGLKNHSGQISFPGGMSDGGESVTETALRETDEEVGLDPGLAHIIGFLSELYVLPSDSVITPVVAFLKAPFEIDINPDEVEEAFFIDFDLLLSDGSLKIETWDFKDVKADVPLWEVGRKTPLWGATAMIMQELIDLYREFEFTK